MEQVTNLINTISNFFWDWPLVVLLLATGVFTLIGFRGRMTFKFQWLWKNSMGKAFQKNDSGIGTIRSFASACTALANTVGTGNISGVASAIAVGGPGAVFWMWVSGILGMSTKAAEIIIGQRYRTKFQSMGDEYMCNRNFAMHIALGWRVPAIIFSVIAVITQPWNALVQTNSIAISLDEAFGIPQMVTIVAVVAVLAVTIAGGIRRISALAEKVVPLMAILYIGLGLVLVIINWQAVPAAIASIFKFAFTPMAGVGGVVGISVRSAVRYGIARGLYSNDSGIGAAICLHAPAKTDHPVRQAAWGFGENLVDTLFVCTITALSILVTNVWIDRPDISSAQLTTVAFKTTFGWLGGAFIAIAITLFAWTTLLGTYWQNEKSVNYLLGDKTNYKWVIWLWMAYYLIPQFFAHLDANFLWAVADLTGVCNVLVTVTMIFCLRKEIFRLCDDFFNRYQPELLAGKNPSPVSFDNKM